MTKGTFSLVAGVVLLMEIAYITGTHAYALAAQPDETPVPIPTPTQSIAVIETQEPDPTPIITPTLRPATPEPTKTPDWAPAVSLDSGEFRCLARYKHSSIPSDATMITQIVACEVVQNRTVNKGFPDTVRRVLLSGDFGGYDPESSFYKADRMIADFVTRSWAAALDGDYSFRFTPPTGIYLCYTDDNRHCIVYDAKWNVVCDTSQFE